MMSAPPTPDLWLSIMSLIIGGGGLKYAYDAWHAWKNGPPHALRRQGVVDASIATVARARDELEEDNLRLRQTLAEERKQHAEERKRWLADITRPEEQIRIERAEAQRRAVEQEQRYDALLTQVQHLRRPPTMGDVQQ